MDQPKKMLRSEHLGISGDNSFAPSVSASRETMNIKMQAQTPVLVTSDINPILSGAEKALNLTYDVKVRHDGIYQKIISKFPHAVAGKYNSSLLIYDRDDGVTDCINLPSHFYQHTEFGYPYVPQQPVFGDMLRRKVMRKGDVLLDTPNRKQNGWYGNGRLLNVIALSHPAVGDDGVAVCSDVLEKLAYYTFSTSQFNVGGNKVLINAYGTAENPQSIPEIGQKVRDDGLLAAIRTYNDETALTMFTNKALQTPDELTDELFLVPPNSIVVDVDIIYNSTRVPTAALGIHKQIERLHSYIENYHREIKNYFDSEIAGYSKDSKLRKDISDEFACEVKNAINRLATGNNYSKCYRRTPINEWLITVTTMSICVPQMAAKITGKGTADKGVITRILPPEEMPVTDDGVRADVITSLDAPFGRMTLGAITEPSYNSVAARFLEAQRKKYEIPKSLSGTQLTKKVAGLVGPLANEFLYFHEKVGEESKEKWLELTEEEIVEYLCDAFTTGIPEYFLPIDREGSEVDRSSRIFEETVDEPVLRNISYMHKGKRMYGKFKAVIGARYIQLLEQTAQDVCASASSTMQVTGMVAHKSPYTDFGRRTPTITTRLGNSETRLITYNSLETYSDREKTRLDPQGTMIAELLSRNGSRKDHELCVKAILDANEPGNIERLIDRKKHPYSTVRVVGIFNSIALSQGYRYIQEGAEDDPVF